MDSISASAGTVPAAEQAEGLGQHEKNYVEEALFCGKPGKKLS